MFVHTEWKNGAVLQRLVAHTNTLFPVTRQAKFCSLGEPSSAVRLIWQLFSSGCRLQKNLLTFPFKDHIVPRILA